MPPLTKLPVDAWIGLHQDGSLCYDWTHGSIVGAGVIPLIRVRDTAPPIPAECDQDGEALEWTRITLMRQNAAATAGGRGAVRFEEESDDDD